jgi:hypothetical protein
LKIGIWQNKISPHQAGIFLYSTLIAFLLFTSLRTIWQAVHSKNYAEQKNNTDAFLMTLLCFFYALSHLAFNVLLTGTHERYFYLGYPFLLISVMGFYYNYRIISGRLVLFCFFAAFAYGCFVFSIIGVIPAYLFPLQRQEFLASIHLFLLILLLDTWIQICYFNKIKITQ